jgi:hypothetical protein
MEDAMPALSVVFQSIKVENDHDPNSWYNYKGAGEIYINYNVNDGINHANGTLGEYEVESGRTQKLGETVAVFDDVDTLVALNVSVWDNDWPDGDDHLGDLNLAFDASQDFGIGSHSADGGDFVLNFSIVPV